MGVVVGDALGMPVQFVDRVELKNNPVETMEGYGTYNMPPGTWSDDSSMALATFDSIRDKGDIDYSDIMERFVRWNFYGEYTPAGKAFDQGNTCMEAICNFVRDKNYIIINIFNTFNFIWIPNITNNGNLKISLINLNIFEHSFSKKIWHMKIISNIIS